MTMISDLTKDLVEEILSKAPITSLGAVRSTCKQWNASSKDRLLCKAEPREQFLRFMVMDHRFLSMTFNLHGILKGDGEVFVRPSIKEVGDIVNQNDISKVFHCDGLVLCVANDNSSLVVWNPYLGQTKWIEAREPHDESDMFALGYDKDKNHKILRLYDEYYNYKFYNLKTESWGEEDYLPGWDIDSYNRGVALNGNTYFLTQEQRAKDKYSVYLLCFDFTRETFGEFLAMPFKYHRKYIGTLSCVGNEKLAALYQRWDTSEMAIWVTTKIESNEVLWSNLFKVDMKPLIRFGFQYCRDEAGSFFFDEEKKLAVVFNLDRKSDKRTKKKHCYHTAYIVGVKGYLRKVVLGEAVEVREGVYRSALVCSSSYVPSLEKINHIEEEDKCKSTKMVDAKGKDKKRKIEQKDLVEEILCRVPITCLGAVRSTCKGWNALSTERILCIGEPKQQFLGFMLLDYRLCSMRFNFHEILNEDGLKFVYPSIKKVDTLLNNRFEISKVFYSAGLLLCVTSNMPRLVVWNPYLGQTRWINTKTTSTTGDTIYALGYDNNKNHKILRFFYNNQGYYEIYDFKSNSWRDFNVTPNWAILFNRKGASVNGNTYFRTKERIAVDGRSDSDSSDLSDDEDETPDLLICFDFTAERFGKLLDLPFQHDYNYANTRTLTCVKEEKLVVLNHHRDTTVVEIWVTTKIVPNEVSWTSFLKVDIKPLVGPHFLFNEFFGSFFIIDEEKKLAVVNSGSILTAYIIGENRYLKKVNLGEVEAFRNPVLVCSSYVPSLVQINQTAVPKRRENKRKRKSKNKKRK